MFTSSPCTPQQPASHTGTLSDDNRFAFMLLIFLFSLLRAVNCAIIKNSLGLPTAHSAQKKRQYSTRHFLSFFLILKHIFPIWSHLVVVVPALVLVYPPVARPVASQLFRVSDEAVVERHGGHHGLVQLGAAGAGAEGRVQRAQVVGEEGLE